jgi:uncharacterized alkaline shock family protein YloU
MGLFDRIVLTAFTFSMAFLSFIFVLMSLGWLVPLTVLQSSITQHDGRLVVGILGAVFFVVSLRFIHLGFRRRYPLRTVVHENDLGEVRVSLWAVENLVARVTRQVKGVREVKAAVSVLQDGLRVNLRIWVSPEGNIPKVSAETQEAVKSYVRDVVGAEVRDIHIFVENITNESRRGRVD